MNHGVPRAGAPGALTVASGENPDYPRAASVHRGAWYERCGPERASRGYLMKASSLFDLREGREGRQADGNALSGPC